MNNILAICNYSKLRPRYTKGILPQNGFGYLYRQASAVNQLESWFSVCCSNGTQDEEMILCCAKQAVRTHFHLQFRVSNLITQCVEVGSEISLKRVVMSAWCTNFYTDLLNMQYDCLTLTVTWGSGITCAT